VAVVFAKVTAGLGMTVTITVSLDTQPAADIPTTTYWVVTDGVAIGLAKVAEFNPAEGDQKYVEAPVALRETELP
jgi:hypothetical protein